jgi:hypothetical protein
MILEANIADSNRQLALIRATGSKPSAAAYLRHCEPLAPNTKVYGIGQVAARPDAQFN